MILWTDISLSITDLIIENDCEASLVLGWILLFGQCEVVKWQGVNSECLQDIISDGSDGLAGESSSIADCDGLVLKVIGFRNRLYRNGSPTQHSGYSGGNCCCCCCWAATLSDVSKTRDPRGGKKWVLLFGSKSISDMGSLSPIIPESVILTLLKHIETKFSDLGRGQFLHDHQNQVLNTHVASYSSENQDGILARNHSCTSRICLDPPAICWCRRLVQGNCWRLNRPRKRDTYRQRIWLTADTPSSRKQWWNMSKRRGYCPFWLVDNPPEICVYHCTWPSLDIFSGVDKYQPVHKGLEVIITSDLVWLVAERKENVLKARQCGRIYVAQWGFVSFHVLADSISCGGVYSNFLVLPVVKGKASPRGRWGGIPGVFNLLCWSQNPGHKWVSW